MKKIKGEIIYVSILLFIGLICATGVQAIDYGYTKLSPREKYFNYDYVKSIKDYYEVGEELSMSSKLSRYKYASMEYHDILWCDFGDGIGYMWYSEKITHSKRLKPAENKYSPWRYEGDIPNSPAKCYIESSPSVLLDYGIEKTQKIKSNIFYFVR